MQFASTILSSVFGKNLAMNITGGNDNKTNEIVSPPRSGGNANTVSQILSRLENKKEQAAVNLGIGKKDVETIPFDLSMLETEGVFLNIDASGFGVLERQIEWKTLGVKLPEQATVRVSPPRAGLLPDVYRRKLLRASHECRKSFAAKTLCKTQSPRNALHGRAVRLQLQPNRPRI